MGPIRDATQAAQAVETCLLRQLIDASGSSRAPPGRPAVRFTPRCSWKHWLTQSKKGGGIGLARLIENSLPAGSDDLAQATANFLQSLPLILLKACRFPYQ